MRTIANAVLGALLIAYSSPSLADTPGNYAFNLGKNNPKALALFQTIVPVKFRGQAWINRLDGTGDEMRTVQLRGQPYLLGWVCKPHDCGNNQLAFLIALDLSHAAAELIMQDGTSGKPLWLGAPPADEKVILQKRIDE